jgi:ribosome-binding protein aMBF1 (putative translation factor)
MNDGYRRSRPPVNGKRRCSTKIEIAGRCMRMITPAQSRAARALIEWSQEDLAKAAHLGLSTIRDFEKGRRTPTHNNLLGIKTALETAGVRFIAPDVAGEGVILADPSHFDN